MREKNMEDGERERGKENEWMRICTCYFLDAFSYISILGVKKWKIKFCLHI